MIDELRKNVDTEIEMLREISNYTRMLDYATPQEARLLNGAINSLNGGIKMINKSVPTIVRTISLTKKLPAVTKQEKQAEANLESVQFKRLGTKVDVVLDKNIKEKFLKELSISEKFIKKIKKAKPGKKEEYAEFKGARGYVKLANRFFLNKASEMVKRGRFKSLYVTLKKANVEILFESYVAVILFSVFLSIIFSIVLMIFLLFINVSFLWPFFEIYRGSYLVRFVKIFWIPIVVPILTFLAIYFYPTTEKSSIAQRIEQELPFAVIHMSSISGSGIPPAEIFKIIGLSKEYPYLRKEIRKILNQINLYGYDLITALKNAAKTAPSERLAELFSGLATTITSGANLSEFFEKRSESLLLNYRLEREKYTKLVETFLDIYISIVIAAPMVFLLLLIMMAISGFQVGLTSFQLSLLAIFTIAVLNIIFMIFLQIKQPTY